MPPTFRMVSHGSTFLAVESESAGPAVPYRFVVVATHPIQYFAPWFRQLATLAEIDLTVVYLRQLDADAQGAGFGQAFKWDVPLLAGYVHQTINVAPGVLGAIRTYQGIKEIFQLISPQAVLVMGWNEPALIAAAARSSGPVLVRGDSNALKPRSWMVRQYHLMLMKLYRAYLAVGRSNSEFYVANKVDTGKIFDVCHFVENDRMLAMAVAHESEASELRLLDHAQRETDVVFVFCGKHVPFKRPDWLVEAAGRLIAEGLPVRLRIAGSGEMTALLKARCEALGVPAHFTGFLNQTEMWRAYVGADVFVLPSTHRETWGLVVNEAMLFGLPAIVRDEVGCGPDLVVEGETGWIFTGGLDGLVGSMRDAVAQRMRLRPMGEAARQRVRENYSMEVATRGLLQAIKAVVK